MSVTKACSTVQTRLFVGNIPNGTKETELRNAFIGYGDIINLDLKSKPTLENNANKFAFITINGSNNDVENCIRQVTKENFKGQRLFVTRARESFLERLNRERLEQQEKENLVNQFSKTLTPEKRNLSKTNSDYIEVVKTKKIKNEVDFSNPKLKVTSVVNMKGPTLQSQQKKQDSDNKRLESMKMKKREFEKKQNIIKSGLLDIDKVHNNKIKFSLGDLGEEKVHMNESVQLSKKSLFTDNDSEEEIHFFDNEHYRRDKEQKVLDLQSTYKSDKRFVLNKEFIDDILDTPMEASEEKTINEADETAHQLSILQDILGVPVKAQTQNKKAKPGMIRFDPMHPDHSKFLAPIKPKPEIKKLNKREKKMPISVPPVKNGVIKQVENVERSKKQFYNVTESLKEAITKHNIFTFRSIFAKNDESDIKETSEENANSVPVDQSTQKQNKNPFDSSAKNPFIYDSSDSDDDSKHNCKKNSIAFTNNMEMASWKENLFFAKRDVRFKDALAFFNKSDNTRIERRELKTVMKKRIHNKEKQSQMFQKKIGGKKQRKQEPHSKKV